MLQTLLVGCTTLQTLLVGGVVATLQTLLVGGVVATLQSRSHNQSLNLVLCLENCWLKARKCGSSYRLSVTFTFIAFYYQELFNHL